MNIFYDLEIISAILREKSMRKAAQSIHMTQSAVSKKVMQIENELGFSLFSRTSHGVTLTKSGETFLSYANQSLELLRNGIQQAKHDSIDMKIVKVGVTSPLISLVNNFVNYYKDSNPYIYRIDVATMNSLDVVNFLREGLLDFGIFSFPETPKGLNSSPLYKERFYLFGKQKYFLNLNKYEGKMNSFIKPEFINSLKDIPFILPKTGQGLRIMIDNMIKKEFIFNPTIIAEADTSNLIEHLVFNSYGCGILSLSNISSSIRLNDNVGEVFTYEQHEDLIYIPINFLFPQRNVYFAHGKQITNFPMKVINRLYKRIS